ncbi:MAG: hypothetical protein F6J87_07840 [Spirulina sp. SIO3F2]|nr:hypothetical protein [Spirulina sp. SIO3F2]
MEGHHLDRIGFRQHLIIAAVQGLCANPTQDGIAPEELAERAVAIAEAVIEKKNAKYGDDSGPMRL